MKRCTKEVEIELSDGTVVEATLVVTGIYDEDFSADPEKKERGAWLVDSWEVDHDDDTVTDDLRDEFEEEIEEIVFSEKWDFENVPETDDDVDDLLSPEDLEH